MIFLKIDRQIKCEKLNYKNIEALGIVNNLSGTADSVLLLNLLFLVCLSNAESGRLFSMAIVKDTLSQDLTLKFTIMSCRTVVIEVMIG